MKYTIVTADTLKELAKDHIEPLLQKGWVKLYPVAQAQDGTYYAELAKEGE